MSLLEDLRAARRLAGMRPVEALDDAEPALLFIPDISGFTRFIEEADHPQAPHLVADLLEILVEANTLDMEVAEIQGDAILFYRLGEPPSAAEMVEQCRRVFLDFQNYLKMVARDTGSELVAALQDADLTLKIVVHYGRVSVSQIRNFTKLLGRDVIVAHRLLKNNVTGSEYILLTEDYLSTQPPAELARCFSWTRLQQSATVYDYLGEISYRYAYLTPLRLLLQTESDNGKLPTTCRIKVRRVANVPATFAFRVLTNFRLRPRWLAGTSAVHYDITKAYRPGTSYKLDLYNGQIDLQAVQRIVADDHIEYVEKVSHWRLFPNSMLIYYIEEVDDQHCLISIEFRYGHVASPLRTIRRGQLRRLRRWLGQSMRQLTAFCEGLVIG
ncbi:DUF2652 domain-containing protein [Solirubrum puertoriconensis]|uniref:Guanylate cyclase domain-containing protein n=1 Tax=Solirubrum puertoriconensis TaxID=1751427 RepID=A0A9X0HLC4_SOLP1|nr:DUF2652 domain-containing protein [Solirubrum puertoriconensis]KUG08122.1 hypothetical protein ASU33_07960 [Solirubrum puertoriconensis]